MEGNQAPGTKTKVGLDMLAVIVVIIADDVGDSSELMVLLFDLRGSGLGCLVMVRRRERLGDVGDVLKRG